MFCARRRVQPMRSSNARAAVSREEAGFKLLNPIYERFTEGFDTPDLKAARALLDRIG